MVVHSPARFSATILIPLAAAISFAVLGSVPIANGQGFFRPIVSTQSGRFIEAPRAIEQQLRDAERALQEDRWSDAVVRLGDLAARDNEGLDESDLGGQDFFLDTEEVTAGIPIQTSLLRAARKMIGELPPAAIETYELRYGPIARRLLTEASQRRDWERVREVRRRYFHTTAGYEASFLLAQREMYFGRPLSASLILDDVVSQQHAIDQLGAGIAVLHAAASKLSGRDVPAVPTGEISISGKSQTIPAVDQQSDWLSGQAGELDSFEQDSPKDYAMFGATTSRNGGWAGQMPLTNLRWMLNTTASPRQERTLRDAADELTSSGKLPPPTWMPIRVGDQLLMRTTERLVGVDYRTGKRVWTYPWQSAFEVADEDELSFDELAGEDQASDLLSQRVWNDVPYGQVTSDGSRVFMLDDLGEVETMSLSPMINLRGTRPAETSTNTLVALDMATEGKLLWRLGAGAEESSALSDAFFLGPPLPIDGRLYVMVEIAGDINLVCLDPATGAEIWRQHLVAVESGGIESDPVRRVAGAMPTYHEGILICPTGAGATVAIDLADRMLRWGTTYERNTEMNRSLSNRGAGIESGQLMQRWDNGIAVADGRTVLVTPVEADHLFGFDLLTGTKLLDKNRLNMRYLAGIRDNRFFVVGGNQVRAFDVENNNTAVWTSQDLLTAGQQIAGRGVFGEGTYLIPTTTNQLIQISLDDGSVIERRSTRYPLGNLVAVDGEIIVQGPTSLAVAYGEATLEPLVNQMLAENPNDFEALVRKSELMIQRNQRTEALALLERARQMEPDNDEVHMLSVSAMLGLLRENANVDPKLIETLDELIDLPAQRVELLSLRIRASLEKKDYTNAAERLIDFSSLLISESMLENVSDHVINDPTRQCSLDSWIAARMKEIADSADDQEIVKINERLGQVSAARRDASSNLLERLYHHFRSFDGIGEIRSELISRYQNNDEHLRLERLLLGTQLKVSEKSSHRSMRDSMLLAENYAQGGLGADALAVLDEGSDEEGDSDSPVDSNSSVDSDSPVDSGEREALVALAQSRMPSSQWPDTASVTWDSRQIRTRFGSNSQRISKTEVLTGEKFVGWQLVSDSTTPIALRDAFGMTRVIPMEGTRPGEEVDKEAQISGGVMMILMPSGLACVDLYHFLAGDGEAVLWQRSLSGDGAPIAKRRGVPTPFGDQVIHYYITSAGASPVIPEFTMGPVLGDRLLLLQGGDLMAVDLISKETLWRNSTAPASGVVVSDGKRVAVVSPATSEVVYFDLLDGKKIATQPWEYGEIWEAIGTNVLAYQKSDSDGQYDLKLIDPMAASEDQVKLSQSTHASSRGETKLPSAYGRIVDGRYLSLMQSTGEAIVWDLANAREVASVQLPSFDNLLGMHAMMFEGQMIFLPHRNMDGQRDNQLEQLQTTDGTYHQPTHGIFAVSMTDGSLRWGQEFEKPWGCTLTQAPDTPILLLTRSPFVHSVQSRKKSLDVLGLDVRDGHELISKMGKPILSANNELEVRLTVQPPMSRVIAQIGPELLTFKFGEPEDITVQPDDQGQPSDAP